MLQLKKEYAHYPQLLALVKEYEAQKTLESRFVRMVDKLAPLLVHINDNLSGLQHGGFDATEIRQNAAERARGFLEQYPDQVDIIGIRNELSLLVAHGLETS